MAIEYAYAMFALGTCCHLAEVDRRLITDAEIEDLGPGPRANQLATVLAITAYDHRGVRLFSAEGGDGRVFRVYVPGKNTRYILGLYQHWQIEDLLHIQLHGDFKEVKSFTLGHQGSLYGPFTPVLFPKEIAG